MSLRRILVADDEEPVRRLVSRVLQSPGREVLIAADGAAALELAALREPDLVVLDVSMPGTGGLEVLAELRRRPRTRLTPVILLTGAAGLGDKVDGLSRGADDYMTKPFAVEELAARVEGLLRRHQLALDANPLTGLPGNPAIEEELERLIALKDGFALMYADIDRFKAFNDVRGFAAGDGVLLKTAALLRESMGEAFVGHVGGDDFVAICGLAEAPHAAQRLASAFDAAAARYFQGLTLSIGIATTANRPFSKASEAAAVAAEMKAYLKRDAGTRRLSRFAFDRRGPSDRAMED